MRLQDLIDVLEQQPPSSPVLYSDGTYPGRFASWRGIYSQLTLTPRTEGMTCGALLKLARSAEGSTFTGWKGGGDYQMDGQTPVWADEAGACDYHAIVGYVVDHGVLHLTRQQISEYRDW